MKSRHPQLVLGILLTCTSAWATGTLHESEHIPLHLDLEMEGVEYRRVLQQSGVFPQLLNDDADPDVAPAGADLTRELSLGKRNLDFLDHLNSFRPESERLALTSPALQPGYPLDAPRESSPSLIRQRLAEIESSLPSELRAILFAQSSFPQGISLSDEEYLNWARKVDGIYQAAARWKLQEPYLQQYKARRSGDIRGYAFLVRDPSWREDLARWSSLDSERQSQLRSWIQQVCFNSEVDSSACQRQLQEVERNGKSVLAWTERYLPKSESIWNSYFQLRNRRSDVKWQRQRPELMTMPFKDPRDPAVSSFLIDNIEDEWKAENWNLKLKFESSGSWIGMAQIVFQPGATPHVNRLGGDIITMDANQPLTEYGTRWTIRHEFGHVLGLPDCYIEFFDSDRDVMVSYQIDLDNLMCSRRGRFQPIHFEELKKAYLR